MTPPWMLLRLAIETAAHHAIADEERLSALSIATVGEYRCFLARVFGFESVVEQSLMRLFAKKAPQLERRMRWFRLRADLQALGMSEHSIAALPVATNLHIPSTAHALGWMFVLERQHLVSGQLRRHIQDAVAGEADHALRYLDVVGETRGTAFRTFGEELGLLSRHHPPAKMVAGATDAFRAQRQWYVALPARKQAASTSLDDARRLVAM